MRNDGCDEVPGTLALALTLWAGAVAAGTRADVFLRLAPEAYAALIAFAIAFAASVVTVDARVRAWLDRRGAQSAWLALSGLAGLAVAAAVDLASATPAGAGLGRFAAAPWAPILLFGVPVTLALAAAAVRALRSGPAGAIRQPASTTPAPRRAAPSGSRTSVGSAAAARARAAG